MSSVNETKESGISNLKSSLVFAYLTLLFNPIIIYFGVLSIANMLGITTLWTILLGNSIKGIIVNLSFHFDVLIFNILSMVKFF
ncbi:MAG: hypothetical protein ACFFAN_07990 [Promethearchaeota archaeon]